MLVAAATATAAVLLTRDEPRPFSARVAKVRNGMTKQQVRAALGRPEQTSFIPYPTPGEVDEGFQECWDYGLSTLPKTPYYQLCFWNGKLSSQARYGE